MKHPFPREEQGEDNEDKKAICPGPAQDSAIAPTDAPNRENDTGAIRGIHDRHA
jgi:hypothetical protein